MKLPFSQFPELPPGQGLVVGAPCNGGRAFFLTRFAREGLEQGKKVRFLGWQDGNAWLYELVQAGHKELTFLDIFGARLNVEMLDQLLINSLATDLLVVDNFDVITYAATVGGWADTSGPITTSESYLSTRLSKMLSAIKDTATNVVLGVTTHRGTPEPKIPEGATSWSWESLHVTPVVHEHMFAGIPNLTVVRLAKERR